MDTPVTTTTPAAPTPETAPHYAVWSILVIIAIILIGFGWWSNQSMDDETVTPPPVDQPTVNEPAVTAAMPADGNTGVVEMIVGSVNTFTMTSFYEMVNGQPQPQFSVKDISVKKGETVRIVITNTKGNHDFNLDEFNVHVATPLNEEVAVEFVADQTGDFVYYCSMPGHRAAGHWGTLRVTE